MLQQGTRPATIACLVLLASTLAGPASGADDPEAAVTGLFEAIAGRDLGQLDGLVCADQQESVRSAYGDPGLGLDLMSSSFDEMRVEVVEPTIEVVEIAATTATVQVSATIAIEVDDQAMRALVLEIVEEAAGPEDPPITDADVETALPLVRDALGFSRVVDSTVPVVREDGEWVVCGGLGLEEHAPSLCDGVSTAELERVSGRVFDDGAGDAWTCTWTAAGLDDMVVATVSDLGLDDLRQILGESVEREVGGLPAITTADRAAVELPDGRTLDVTVTYDEADEPDLPADLLAVEVVERLAVAVPPEPEPEATMVAGAGLLAGRDHVDDLALALPHEELSELTGVTFEDPGYCLDVCEYYVFDGSAGFHYALTSLEARPITAWLEDYPDARSLEIGGQPAVLAEGVFPDLGASAVAIVAIPGYEDLTFAAGIGVDTSADVEIDATATAEAMVTQGLRRLVGTTD